jgi:large subunit ribosomal protein L3
MGDNRVTTRGLEIVEVKGQDNLLLIKGAIPGAPGGIVIVNKI